jgi:IS5 family transposase
MKRIQQMVGGAGTKLRDRLRSVKRKLIEIARSSRVRTKENQDKLKGAYKKLITTTQRVISQAQKFTKEVRGGVKQAATPMMQLIVDSLATYLEKMCDFTKRVIQQTRARIMGGDTHYKEKIFSIFEPFTEAIRKGKAAKPSEFGKLVKIQEAEDQLILDYEVFSRRPADAELLVPSIEKHKQVYGKAPVLVAGDAGFFTAKNEVDAKAAGVTKFCVPSRSTRSETRRKQQKQRWFRRGQRWRVGCEGRISVIKRRHGLFRSRYRGEEGINRWVGLGVIANNLTVIGNALAKKRNCAKQAAKVTG